MIRRGLFALFMAVGLLALPLHAKDAPPAISAEGAYAYAPIGQGRAGVAYFTLTNPTQTAYQLVGVSSDAFGKIEMHTHLHEEGVMKMRKIEQIDLPAGQSVALKPGGLHLMLFDAAPALHEGQVLNFRLQLQTEDGASKQELAVAVPVKPRRAEPALPKAHEGHGQHE